MIYWRIDAKIYKDIYEIFAIKNNPHKPHLETPWWGNQSMTNEKPKKINTEISIIIKKEKKMPDVLWNGGALEIYSQRMISIFDGFNVNYEIYEPTYINIATSGRMQMPYYIFRLLEIIDAVDYEQSIIEVDEIGDLSIPIIRQLVVKNGIDKHFFRLKGYESLLIVSDSLKKELERKKISGVKFFHQNQLEGDYFLD